MHISCIMATVILAMGLCWSQAATRGVTYEWRVYRQAPRDVPQALNVGGTTLVPLHRLVYLEYQTAYRPDRREVVVTGNDVVYRFTLGDPVADVGTRRLRLPAAPRLITLTPDSRRNTRIAYPYVPLRTLAQAGGWQTVYAKPDVDEPLPRVLLIKHYPPDPPAVPFEQLTGLRLASPAVQRDARVRIEQQFSVDASRRWEYERGSYVALAGSTITNISRAPIFTGNFARFVQTRSGLVFGVESMAQSFAHSAGVFAPGKRTDQAGDLWLTSPLYRIATNEPVARVIYNDGISAFTWEVGIPADR